MASLLRQWQKVGSLSRAVNGCGVTPAFARPYSTTVYAAADANEAPAKAERVKRPSTAYTTFLKDNYNKIAAEHPDKKGVKELGSIIAQKWAALTDAEKTKYKETAAAARAAFDKQYPDGVPKQPKKEKKEKKAKKAPSAYNLFVAQRLVAIRDEQGVTTKEAFTLAGKEWSTLSQAEKDAYKQA